MLVLVLVVWTLVEMQLLRPYHTSEVTGSLNQLYEVSPQLYNFISPSPGKVLIRVGSSWHSGTRILHWHWWSPTELLGFCEKAVTVPAPKRFGP